ncbi:ribosome biogenesis protein tsr1 [Dipsacomyces acuminosporus]|nr:ribosome biogenesis protein tsr1 [Dipsacomyces acuminosporus]
MGKEQGAFHHRASLKQKHKPFKRRHATKNALRDKAKGRTQRAAVKGKVMRKHTRIDRRNAVKNEQRKKREQIVMSTRIFSGRHRAPKIVAVIPLCSDVRVSDIVRSLYESVDEQYQPDVGQTRHMLNVARFKQTLQFVEVSRNLLDILDVAKVADYMVMGISAEVEVDAFGEHCLSALQNQGHSSVFPVVQGLENLASKRRNDVKKSLQSFMSHFFPDVDKVYTTETSTESMAILRMITSQVPKGIKWREIRPYMLADQVEFEPSAEDAQVGRLAISGYLRGANLSANRLIHIPNFGDFQIDQIFNTPIAIESAKGNSIDEDNEPILLDKPDPEHQDSLLEANEPDLLNNEQTWPEEEEMEGWKEQMRKMEEDEERMAAENGERVIRVPKGTSKYQAAWIADSEGEDDGSDLSDYDDDDDDDMMADSDSGASDYEDESRSATDPFKADADEGEEYEEIRVDAQGNPIADDENEDENEDVNSDNEGMLSPEEEERQLKDYLKQRSLQNRDDLQFPDEVDTPMDTPARERFARYRGLQSFRTSPWDPYENLPLDYSRIFQFENFKRTQQRVIRQMEDAPVKAGMHVRIILKAVPAQVAVSYNPHRPFVVFGLMQYEHQMSVVHFTITRNEDYTEPVRSKDPMIIHYGFRRYNVQPLFSQHTRGGPGTNNVHKFERFLQHGTVAVGTIFAPIQFGSAPVSLYLPTPAAASAMDSGDEPTPVVPTLIGTGTSLEANPSRILAKRIILTGAPFKIHKRGAVIRYMFFNPEDIEWFKPVQLRTKYGRIGHIRDSLGTHGYMKCIFDGPIKQMDTICMNLYKRVFPKWTTGLWSEEQQSEEQKQQWIGPVVDKPEAMET